MTYKIDTDLSRARILLSNDDGIRAPGLEVLERIARSLSDDVWIVAPEEEQSGASHSLTLRRPLRIRELGPKRFAVDGTPTDCVLLAVNKIMRDCRPTLMLSGINYGGNMGEDVTYSGTVAAAMEATMFNIPSIALSLAVPVSQPPRWDAALPHVPDIIRRLVAAEWPSNMLVNINIPNLDPAKIDGYKAVSQGRRKIGDNIVKGIDPRNRDYYWIGPNREEDVNTPGTDIWAVRHGSIAVTPIYLDLTHVPALQKLQKLFP